MVINGSSKLSVDAIIEVLAFLKNKLFVNIRVCRNRELKTGKPVSLSISQQSVFYCLFIADFYFAFKPNTMGYSYSICFFTLHTSKSSDLQIKIIF